MLTGTEKGRNKIQKRPMKLAVEIREGPQIGTVDP